MKCVAFELTSAFMMVTYKIRIIILILIRKYFIYLTHKEVKWSRMDGIFSI